ncbi:hypothetical protein CRJ29_25540 [Salmonella enterica]|nr:hypothetical protein [Salmonella enterica]
MEWSNRATTSPAVQAFRGDFLVTVKSKINLHVTLNVLSIKTLAIFYRKGIVNCVCEREHNKKAPEGAGCDALIPMN